MQAFQRNTTVLIGHLLDDGTLIEPSHVGGRERQKSVHDEGTTGSDSQEAN